MNVTKGATGKTKTSRKDAADLAHQVASDVITAIRAHYAGLRVIPDGCHDAVAPDGQMLKTKETVTLRNEEKERGRNLVKQNKRMESAGRGPRRNFLHR